jgi:hypothetical protein
VDPYRVLLTMFMVAGTVVALSIIGNLILYVGLRRRSIQIHSLKYGLPGYLLQLCRQLPPSSANARLSELARWSEIALWSAFLVGVFGGVLLGQNPR